MDVRQAAKPRPRSEVLVQLLQPLADQGVRLLWRLGVNPLLIVAAHALCGFAAAALLADGRMLAAAILLQAKTLLDNMDGGLARASGQVTQMGRYLDTGMDFLVNIALFAALALYGPPLLAFGAFALLTLMLSLDYQAERRYRLERELIADDAALPIGAPEPLYRAFAGLYRRVLAPQDRWLARLEERRFERLSGQVAASAPVELRLAWADLFSSAALVNLGLSTQLFIVGVFLVLGQPFWYVYAIFAQALYVVCVQLLRELRFRRYLHRTRLGQGDA